MRITILGVAGMLGLAVNHALLDTDHDVRVYSHDQCDISYEGDVDAMLQRSEPDVVINCAGRTALVSDDPRGRAEMISANALGPHVLAQQAAIRGNKVLHVSTDCVFGRGLPYPAVHLEHTDPGADDLYSATKLAGEIRGPNCMTVRTSFIGLQSGLLKWLTEQEGYIEGWANVHWTGHSASWVGRTLVALAELMMVDPVEGRGLLHIPAPQWNKRELLSALARELELPVKVIPETEPRINRALESSRWHGLALPPIGCKSMVVSEVRAEWEQLKSQSPLLSR